MSDNNRVETQTREGGFGVSTITFRVNLTQMEGEVAREDRFESMESVSRKLNEYHYEHGSYMKVGILLPYSAIEWLQEDGAV